jgi:hypothetical protein
LPCRPTHVLSNQFLLVPKFCNHFLENWVHRKSLRPMKGR